MTSFLLLSLPSLSSSDASFLAPRQDHRTSANVSSPESFRLFLSSTVSLFRVEDHNFKRSFIQQMSIEHLACARQAPKQIIRAGVPKDLGIWWEETDTRINGDLFCEKGRDGSTHREPREQGFSLRCVEFRYLPRLSFCHLAVRAERESGAEMQREHTGKAGPVGGCSQNVPSAPQGPAFSHSLSKERQRRGL